MRKALSKPVWGFVALGIATIPYIVLIAASIFSSTANMQTFDMNATNPGTSFLMIFNAAWALAPITGFLSIGLTVMRWQWKAVDIVSLVIAGLSIGLGITFGMMV